MRFRLDVTLRSFYLLFMCHFGLSPSSIDLEERVEGENDNIVVVVVGDDVVGTHHWQEGGRKRANIL